MNFDTASNIASLLAKSFARDFFRLLVTHKDISASEAASRLDLHIRTAQDFLEGLHREGIVSREEVMEGKRPYYRYALVRHTIQVDLDLKKLVDPDKQRSMLNHKIREKKNNRAVFYTPNNQDFISSVMLFIGEGRRRKERKINLTKSQGRFLFHLPFPNSDHVGLKNIMKKADLTEDVVPEILDLMTDLISFGVVETKGDAIDKIAHDD